MADATDGLQTDGELAEAVREKLCAVNALLLEERSTWGEPVPAMPPAEEARAQWDLFRALVNMRPPVLVPEGLLELQDGLLQDILALRGVTKPEAIRPTADSGAIKLWRGDITTLGADAIVNAANSQMLGCFVPGHHCIDNAIHTFAGVQLRLECACIMEAQGFPEPTGMAKATDAFNLPSKHILHTVGPIAQGQVSETDRGLLADCYRSCLDVAADLECESLAFCCISTGVFGFPQDEAARIAVTTVREWLQSQESGMTVIFDVFSAPDEALYEQLL